MATDQEISIALGLIQAIALFMPVVLGVTTWLVRELKAAPGDDPEFRRKQQNKQTIVTYGGLSLIIFLAIAAGALIIGLYLVTDLHMIFNLGISLLIAAFVVFALIAVAALTDNFQWLA